MADDSERARLIAAMRQVNDAWLGGRFEELAAAVHPNVVMVFPGFVGRVEGREAFVAGFREFFKNAIVHDYQEREAQIDVAGKTAVVTFQYEMVYERAAERYRATGRDLWIFEKDAQAWIAVWRTMLDMQEKAA